MFYSQFKFAMKSKGAFLGLSLLGGVLLSTALLDLSFSESQAIAITVDQLIDGQSKDTDKLPNLVEQRILQQVAAATGVDMKTLKILSSSAETWSDSCFGIGTLTESCAAVMTPGWRIVVNDGTIYRVYRTDAEANSIREELQFADVEEFPRLTASRILDEIRRSSAIPLEQLDIVATEPRVWGGCYGLGRPNQACTRIAIQGWRVIVKAPQNVWVFHTNQDGTEIRRNDSASGSGKSLIVPEFIDRSTSYLGDIPRENLLISVMMQGGFAGISHQTVLYRDGSVVRFNLAGDRPISSQRLGTVPQNTLAKFTQKLSTTQLERFEGLRYPPSPGTADSFTVTLIPNYHQAIQYDDTIVQQLPLALQQFHSDWNALLASVQPDEAETPTSNGFADIATSPYFVEIQQVLDLGLMAGYDNQQFQPQTALTREQMAVLVHRLMERIPLNHPDQKTNNIELPSPSSVGDVSSFKDVAGDRWSSASIEYLSQLGLLKGYPDNRFYPEKVATRAELIALLMKTDNYLVERRQWDGRDAFNLNPAIAFSDIQNHWAERIITVMSENCGVASPIDSDKLRFAPDAPATRGFAASAVIREFQCLSLNPSDISLKTAAPN